MRYLRRVFRILRDFRRAAHRYGTSTLSLLRRALLLQLRRGLTPRESLEDGLLDPSLPEGADTTSIGKAALMAIQRRVNAPERECLTEDKAVFYHLCQQLRLPVPALYAVFGAHGGYSAEGQPLRGREAWVAYLRDDLPAECVLKPAFGCYGLGVRVLRRRDAVFTQHDGRQLSAEDLFDELSAPGPFRKFVFQRRLVADPALQRLSGSRTLQTARVVTYVRDAEVQVDHAYLRIAIADNVVDNLRHGTTGNVMARINCDNGVLAEGWRYDDHRIMIRSKAHPETGVCFAGYQLPYWPEVLTLVRRAAILFLPNLCLGWDVGFTPEGPVLVETNMGWDPTNICAADFSTTIATTPPAHLLTELRVRARRERIDAKS